MTWLSDGSLSWKRDGERDRDDIVGRGDGDTSLAVADIFLDSKFRIECGQLSVDFEPVQKPIDRTIVKIVTLPYDQFQEPTTVMVLKLVVICMGLQIQMHPQDLQEHKYFLNVKAQHNNV